MLSILSEFGTQKLLLVSQTSLLIFFLNYFRAPVDVIPEYIQMMQFYCQSINRIHPKLAFFMPIMNMVSMSSVCKGSLTPIKNFYMTALPGGIGMLRNSILYPIFDDVMRKLVPSGIPQYLPVFYSNLMFGTFKDIDEKMPKVFMFNDLAFGFILWLFTCGISIMTFLGEVLGPKIRQMIGKYIGLYYLLVVFRDRTQTI